MLETRIGLRPTRATHSLQGRGGSVGKRTRTEAYKQETPAFATRPLPTHWGHQETVPPGAERASREKPDGSACAMQPQRSPPPPHPHRQSGERTEKPYYGRRCFPCRPWRLVARCCSGTAIHQGSPSRQRGAPRHTQPSFPGCDVAPF